jgi:hypothetical protein
MTVSLSRAKGRERQMNKTLFIRSQRSNVISAMQRSEIYYQDKAVHQCTGGGNITLYAMIDHGNTRTYSPPATDTCRNPSRTGLESNRSRRQTRVATRQSCAANTGRNTDLTLSTCVATWVPRGVADLGSKGDDTCQNPCRNERDRPGVKLSRGGSGAAGWGKFSFVTLRKQLNSRS